MQTIRIPHVAARRLGEPEPDLTSMVVIHRAMLTDLDRLTDLLSAPSGRVPASGEWADAVRGYAAALLAEIDHHHSAEDDLLWPVIERTAGPAIDLDPLTDDHQALAPVLAHCRASLHKDDQTLGRALGELRDLLREHIAEEERDVFPVIYRYVPKDAYEWVEKHIGRRASLRRLTFTVPWLAGYAEPAELDRMLGRAGLPFRLLLAATKGRWARQERLVFGPPENRP
ncbi:hemerythrin domain-containing protein [Nonomuraea basaltis]|uniref:hemerythrin domain-containing protein n=1 Tax=Nonomuraea basaltis TaxID=2495887 RepID=UPI001486AC47|nr:hemerythrin domain-containing protein [Nonomuraea basaltis]